MPSTSCSASPSSCSTSASPRLCACSGLLPWLLTCRCLVVTLSAVRRVASAAGALATPLLTSSSRTLWRSACVSVAALCLWLCVYGCVAVSVATCSHAHTCSPRHRQLPATSRRRGDVAVEPGPAVLRRHDRDVEGARSRRSRSLRGQAQGRCRGCCQEASARSVARLGSHGIRSV